MTENSQLDEWGYAITVGCFMLASKIINEAEEQFTQLEKVVQIKRFHSKNSAAHQPGIIVIIINGAIKIKFFNSISEVNFKIDPDGVFCKIYQSVDGRHHVTISVLLYVVEGLK